MDWTSKLIIGGCAALVTILIVISVYQAKDFRKKCQEVDGHIVSRNSNAIGITTNGQITVTPNFEVYCYSKDGRLLLE